VGGIQYPGKIMQKIPPSSSIPAEKIIAEISSGTNEENEEDWMLMKKGKKVPIQVSKTNCWEALPKTKPICIHAVTVQNKSTFYPVGKGKITVDSGAGESVCPTNFLPQEPLKQTPKVGTVYRAAGGQALTNKGEKKITFQAGEVLGSMNFQAIDNLQKPLASAVRITEKGNQIVFNDSEGKSYIQNHSTGKRVPLHKDNGVYVMNVEFLSEMGNNQPFQRPE